MRLRYYIDQATGEPHIHAHNVREDEIEQVLARPTEDRVGKMKQTRFPRGWDEERVRRVLEHYETQSDEEAVAEDEAAYESTTHTAMEIPVDLVDEVRELLARRRAS